jgi:hypothetical protein
MKRRTKFIAGAMFTSVLVLGPGIPAFADTVVHPVLEKTLRDGYPSPRDASDALWYREDSRAGGGADLYKQGERPVGENPSETGPTGFGNGALALTTNSQNSAKAQLITSQHVYGALLSDVNALDYYTYQSPNSQTEIADPAARQALPSYQLRIDLDGDFGTTTDVTNLVYEPYWNDNPGDGPSPQQPIAPGEWQFWDATGGQWWTSKTIHCEGGTPDPFDLSAGGGGPPFAAPADVAAGCPAAKVVAVGVNVGTYNPNVVSATDGLHIGVGTDSFSWDFGPK